MANWICCLALPTQWTALNVPKDFPILLFYAHALVCELVKELSKYLCPSRELCRKWQQSKCHFRNPQLRTVLANTIVEACPPYTDGKPASPMWTVSMFQGFCQVCDGGKGK